jgi:plasmid maintenance system antidote protein VapI
MASKGPVSENSASTRSLRRFFGLSDGFWLRMQASHDLKLAKQALGGVLPSIEPFQPT